NLIALPLEMSKQERDGAVLISAYRDIVAGLAQLPGVQSASFVNVLPMSNSWWTGDIGLPGQPTHEIYRNQSAPEYFHVMRTPLLAGRDFRWSDADGAPRVAILNESAARLLFARQNPIGRRITGMGEKGKLEAEVVGVVADARYASMRDAAPPTAYTPMMQDVKNRPSFTAVMRVDGPPGAAIAAARAAIRGVAPDIPTPAPISMEALIAEALATE